MNFLSSVLEKSREKWKHVYLQISRYLWPPYSENWCYKTLGTSNLLFYISLKKLLDAYILQNAYFKKLVSLGDFDQL